MVIDAATLVGIIQGVLLGLFIAIFVLLALSALIGFFRGVIPATYRLLFMLVLVILAVVLVTPISTGIGNADLSGIWKYIVITNTGTGESVIFSVTTVLETLETGLAAFFYLFKVSSDPSTIYSLAVSFGTMIVKYVVLVAEMLLVVTIGNFFCFLLWHILFKHFIPKVARKVVKVRWLGMLEGIGKYIIVGGMMLIPFTSIVNTFNQVWQKRDVDTSASDTLNLIDQCLDTYNDSAFANTFFNWTVNSDGLTADSALLDTFISTSIDGVETSLVDTIQDLGSISTILLGGLTISDNGTMVIDYGYFMTEEALTALFNAFGETGMLNTIVPIVIEVALGSDLLGEYMGDTYIDISKVDWSSELDNAGQMVIDVINSGLLDGMLNEDGSFNESFDPSTLITSALSDENFGYIRSAISRIDKSDLLSKVIPALLYYLANSNAEIAQYLPGSWAEMNTIQWGAELGIVFDALYKINKVCPELVTKLLSFTNTSSSPKASGPLIGGLDQADSVDQTSEILSLVMDNVDSLKSILLGDFDSDGTLLNCDSTGRTIVYDSLGNHIQGRSYCIFDLTLMQYLFPVLTDTIVSAVSTSMGDIGLSTDAITTVINQISSSSSNVKEYKEEFNAILNSAAIMGENPTLLEALSDTSKLTSLTSDDYNTLASVLRSFDNSRILTAVMEPAMESALKSDSMASTLSGLGLSVDDLDLSPESGLGNELANIIESYDSIMFFTDLSSSSMTTSEMIKDLSENPDKLADVLDVVFNSQILNPSADFYDGDNQNNYFTILSYVFGDGTTAGMINADGLYFDAEAVTTTPTSHAAGSHSWANTRTINGNLPTDRYGNIIVDGENGYLALAIAECGKEIDGGGTIFDLVSGGSVDFTKLESASSDGFRISSLLKAVDYSSVLSSTLGSFLDASLESTGIVDTANGISFKNVTNWTAEGNNLGHIVTDMASLGIALDSFDISTLSKDDIPTLNRVLHNLSDSGIFDPNEGEYNFNIFLFKKLSESLSSGSSYNYFCDPKTEATPTYVFAMDDFELTYDGSVYTSSTLKTRWHSATWTDDSTNVDNFYKSDEIGKICYSMLGIFERYEIAENKDPLVQNYDDCFAYLQSGDFTSADAEVILGRLNSCQCMRLPLFHAFDTAFSTMNFAGGSSSFSMAGANTLYLLDDATDLSERGQEIDYVVDIYRSLERCGVSKDSGSIDIATIISNPAVTVNLYDVLCDMNASYILHRFGPIEGETTTTFQDCVSYLLKFDSIANVNFSTDSPKDTYHVGAGHYSDALTKADYQSSTIFPYSGSFDGQDDDIASLMESVSSIAGGYQKVKDVKLTYDDDNNLISAVYDGTETAATKYAPMKDSSGEVTSDFSMVDITKVDSESLRSIMNNMNACRLLEDCVPNAISDIFDQFNSGSLFSGVDFSKANPYYFYGRSGSYDFTKTMDSDEVYYLTELIDSYNDISGLDLSAFSSMTDEEMANFSIALTSIVDSMANTKTLHLFSASDWKDDASSLTVLEQVMRKLYSDSGLSDYSYESSHDVSYASANEKLVANIKVMTKQDLAYADSLTANAVGFSNTWKDEAASICDLLSDARSVTSGSFSGFSFSLSSSAMSPTTIKTLMDDINHVDVISDALPVLVKDMMEKAGMADFSTYNSTDYAHYYLGQRSYDSTGGTQSIYNLLDGFSIKDGSGNHTGYFSISGTSTTPMKDMMDAGISCESLLDLGNESALYQDTVIADSDSSDAVYDGVSCNSLLLYNIFANSSVDSYILGSTTEAKLHTIAWIIDGGTYDLEGNVVQAFPYDTAVEGEAFDNLFMVSSSFDGNSSFSASDISTAKTASSAIYKAVISATNALSDSASDEYVGTAYSHRGYLTSEIMAGLLESLLENEKSNATYSFASTYCQYRSGVASYLNLVPSSYSLVNVKEARGLYGALSLVSTDYTTLEKYTSDFDSPGLCESFAFMDEGTKNTETATVIYASRLHAPIQAMRFVYPTIPSVTVDDFIDYTETFTAFGSSMATAMGIPD